MSEQIMEHIGEDGTFTDEFAKTVIAELGEGYVETQERGRCKTLDDIHDIKALAKSAIDSRRAHAKLSESEFRRPEDTATDEDKVAYKKRLRTELGATGKLEDYLIEKPLNFPEGLPWNEEDAKTWAQFFCDEGYSVEMKNKLVAAMEKETVEAYNKLQQTKKEAFDIAVKEITDKHQPPAIIEMGRLAFRYLDTWGSDEAKEIIGADEETGRKSMNEMPENFEEWNKRGVPPVQVEHMARVAKDMQSGTNKVGDVKVGNLDADADFVAKCSEKSPALQPKG